MKYDIEIKGYIKSEWFDDFKHIKSSDHTTTLRGDFKDQAELYGLLRRIQDLGMALLSLNPVEKGL